MDPKQFCPTEKMGTLNQVFNSEVMERLTLLGIAIKFSASFAQTLRRADGGLAKRLGTALQKPLEQFDSVSHLQKLYFSNLKQSLGQREGR